MSERINGLSAFAFGMLFSMWIGFMLAPLGTEHSPVACYVVEAP